jgi:hypothetical protein
VQIGARPDMRGRIVALYFLIAFGSNVVAGAALKAVSDVATRRLASVVAGGVALAGATVLLLRWRAELDEPPTCSASPSPGTDLRTTAAPVALHTGLARAR